jgi:hypothetical protein
VLLAYADPRDSPAQGLLGQAQREEIAAMVNAAILGTPRPPLYDVVYNGVVEIVCNEAGLTGTKKTDRQVSEALAGRALTEILKIE